MADKKSNPSNESLEQLHLEELLQVSETNGGNQTTEDVDKTSVPKNKVAKNNVDGNNVDDNNVPKNNEDNDGIYVAQADADKAAERARKNSETVETETFDEDLAQANYAQVKYEHDEYIDEVFASAREKAHAQGAHKAATPIDDSDNFEEHENLVDDYPPASFLRSTPPSESTAKILSSDTEFVNRYEPFYESYGRGFSSETETHQDFIVGTDYDEPINSSPNEKAAGEARADKASSKAYSKQPLATRTSRAAMTAGLDLADHFHGNKLKQSVNRTRTKHPYLMERPLTISDEDGYLLIDKVRSVPSYRIDQIANELNSEEIKFVFHAIMLLDDVDAQTFRSLQQIAVIRASWSLYTIGWSTLQRNFPQRKVQSTLELVHTTLISDTTRANVRPSYSHRAIGDIVNLAKSNDGFVTDVVRNLNQSYNLSPEEGLETFIAEYQILVDSPFGGETFGEFFRRADLSVLYKKKDILIQSLPYMHPAISSEVISRVISNRDPLEGDKLYIYKQVADIFLHKTNSSPMWKYMSRDLNRTYREWYVGDRVSIQTQSYPAKRDFLDTYTEYIDDVAMVNQDIMALRFENFILMDDRRRGDSLVYYTYDMVKDLILRGYEEKDLANPRFATTNARQALNNNDTDSVILLNVLPPELEYSRRFLDRTLGKSRRKQRNIFNNWFKD